MKTPATTLSRRFDERMPGARGSARRTLRVAGAAAVALLAAGCATTQIGAQWVDPQWPKSALQGASVLVVCDAQDATVKLICETRFAQHLSALGVKPLTAAAGAESAAVGATTPEARLATARAAGARAVWSTALRPDYSAVSATPSLSIGIGGFGASGGGSRGGVGGGVGVALPVGASSGTGMAASSALTDVGSGKLVWSAQASAPASPDTAAQIDELAGVLAGGLKQAGML